MRIVLDTNVLISALMFGGNPRKILEKVIRGDIELYLSEAIISELGEVLKRPKFGLPISIVNQIISELSSISESVRPSKRINKVKVDPTDNRILECAIEEKAEYIVSWDNHLLDLKEFRSIKIVSPQHFIENSI
jgi:putative PIN family toxin of toxin-antitoxin system